MPTDEPSHAGDGDELEQIRAIARRVGTDPVTWETPPTDLWQRIVAETGRAPARPDDRSGRDEAAVAPIPPVGQRRRSPWSLVAAAAAVVVMAVGAAALVGSLRSDTPVVVAQTELERLGDTGEGRAELVERGDGGFELRLATVSLDVGSEAFAEVWVINPDVTEMISLGPLRRDGRYELPVGLDPAGYPIVDVSIEPFDGDPTHSGNSVLRGQLTF